MGTALTWLKETWWRGASPTAEGGWFVLLLAGVLIAALNTGNNLLYFVLGTQLATLVLSNALAEWNLRGLTVARRLSADVYAGQPAAGAYVVTNGRRWGGSWALHLEELDGGEASATLLRLPVGERREAPARWTFPSRGAAKLGRVRVWSAWPFGLVKRWRVLNVPAEVIVYPSPGAVLPAPASGLAGGLRERPERAGRTGDFRGLRAYQPGDPLKDLHWPTTARTGQPTVVERAAEGGDEVTIEVPERQGPAWEAALSAATGQVLWHAGRGHAIGLTLAGERLPPGVGDTWRRKLLMRLALAPGRSAA